MTGFPTSVSPLPLTFFPPIWITGKQNTGFCLAAMFHNAFFLGLRMNLLWRLDSFPLSVLVAI